MYKDKQSLKVFKKETLNFSSQSFNKYFVDNKFYF